MKKTVKNIIFLLVLGFVLYNSVYFRSLDDFRAENTENNFDAAAFSQRFFEEQRQKVPAVEIGAFLDSLNNNFENYLPANGEKLGISHDYYFMVQGTGTVQSISEENINLSLENNPMPINIATDFIYGNALREASEMAKIGDFQNTMDFNTISIELNKLIREEVIPPFKNQVKEGDQVSFKGALKVSDKNSNYGPLRIIPLVLRIKKNNE